MFSVPYSQETLAHVYDWLHRRRRGRFVDNRPERVLAIALRSGLLLAYALEGGMMVDSYLPNILFLTSNPFCRAKGVTSDHRCREASTERLAGVRGAQTSVIYVHPEDGSHARWTTVWRRGKSPAIGEVRSFQSVLLGVRLSIVVMRDSMR